MDLTRLANITLGIDTSWDEIIGTKIIVTDALIESSHAGNLQNVKTLLSKGIDPNVNTKSGYTPLMVAVKGNHVEIAQRLIQAGSDVNAKTKTGQTPLTMAIKERNLPMVKLLTTAGANVNMCYPEISPSVTCLMAAVIMNEIDIVTTLIDAGADIRAVCSDRTALNLALFACQNLDIAQILVTHGADIDFTFTAWDRNGKKRTRGYTSLMVGIERQVDREIIQFCLDHGADPNCKTSDGMNALSYAVLRGDKELTELLLSHGADASTSNKTPIGQISLLKAAQASGYTEISDLLVSHGATFTEDDQYVVPDEEQKKLAEADEWEILLVQDLCDAALEGDMDKATEALSLGAPLLRIPQLIHVAVISGHSTIVQLLLDHGYPSDSKSDTGVTALEVALRTKQYDMIELLTGKGADVDTRTSNGKTPLLMASKRGDHRLIKQLLDKGANVDVVDSDGMTPLMLASKKGHLPVVTALLNAHAEVNTQDVVTGSTALIHASLAGYSAVVKRLLTAGADPDIQTHKGLTALMMASDKRHVEIVTSLLSAGASTSLKNSRGDTALSMSRKRGKKEITTRLQTYETLPKEYTRSNT